MMSHTAFAAASYRLIRCCIIFAAVLSGANHVSAFTMPEKLVYDLTWIGVKAGAAVLETANDKDTIRVTSTAKSAEWLSVFYMVDDRVETTLAKGASRIFVGRPLNYRIRIREGRHRRDKEIVFDYGGRKAVYIDHLGNEKREVKIHDNVFDPLSVLYYVRGLDLTVGRSVFVDVFDSKKLWNVEVQVLGKERISTVLGDVDTVLVKPLLKSEGIFNRKGEVVIWFTDDQKRIPVKMTSKVAVGAITATLVGGMY